MAKKSKTKNFIAESEQSLAARYFALSNTCMLSYATGGDLNYGFQRANEIMQAECGASLRDELDDWYNQIEAGDSYCYEEWQKVREKYVREKSVAK